MLIIGIDPGESGGVAIIPLYSFSNTQTYSMTTHTLQDISNLFREIRFGSPDISDPDYRLDTQVEVFLEEPQLPVTNFQKAAKEGKSRNFNLQAHKGLNRSIGRFEGICI